MFVGALVIETLELNQQKINKHCKTLIVKINGEEQHLDYLNRHGPTMFTINSIG